MANDSIALIISAFALIVSFVSLYLSRLRGPSIKPIELEESKRTVQIDNSQHPDIGHLPFNVTVSVANSGGTAGIVANPSVSIAPVESLKQEPLRIIIQQITMEPSTSASEQVYGLFSARAYSIPPYSVSVIMLRYHLVLMSLERIPSIDHFTKGCNLKQVHLTHFNSNREGMHVLISKLQRTNTLGQLKVTIDCTEKTFPVLGPMKYKSKEFLSDAPLVYDASLDLLRKFYPSLEFAEQGLWVRIPDYPLPQDKPWNRKTTDVAFQIPVGYPGTAPYGIYVPSGLTCNGATPQNYQDRANQQPPFPGRWGIFSWSPTDGQWKPSSDILAGSNLLNFVRSFADRFREGA